MREPPLRHVLLALRARLLGLLVERRGHARGPPPVGDAAHDDRPPEVADRDLDRVLRPDLLRRLHSHAVHVHAPAGDRLGREPARLEEPRGPEPLVDPHGLHRPRLTARWPAAERGPPGTASTPEPCWPDPGRSGCTVSGTPSRPGMSPAPRRRTRSRR